MPTGEHALTLDWMLSQFRDPWVLFGFAAQGVFFLRFVVQWFESERRGRSHIPISFWWISIAGAAMLLVYSLKIRSLPFAASSVLSTVIYVRNLMLIYRHKARVGAVLADGE